MLYYPLPPSHIEWDFPNNYSLTGEEDATGEIRLELRNDVGRWTIDGELAELTFTPGYIRYEFDMAEDNPFPPEGEYTYILTDGDGRVLSTGLMIVGDYTPDRSEHDTTIEYSQYGQEIPTD